MRLGSVAATLSAVLLVLSACQDRAAAPSAPAMAPSSPAAVETTAATRAVSPSAQVNGPERHILAFGDSLFAGYRLREDEGYPEQLEATLRARGVNARVTDAGVSGDTTAGGRQRIAFVLGSLDMAPDLALVELGGNDLLRGIPPAETRANLTAILDELDKRQIPVLIMGLRAPPNLGATFLSEFEGIYPDLAKKYDARLVPFFLEAVWNRPELIQPDRIHPTAQGIAAIVAATVDEVAAALPKK